MMTIDWQQGYGFQFWRCQHNAYRGDGAFGQFCVVMPDQDAVFVATAGVENMQSVLDLVWEHLLPAMTAEPLAREPRGCRQAARIDWRIWFSLRSCGLRPQRWSRCWQGRRSRLEPTRRRSSLWRCALTDDACVLTLRDAQGEHEIRLRARHMDGRESCRWRRGAEIAWRRVVRGWTKIRLHCSSASMKRRMISLYLPV